MSETCFQRLLRVSRPFLQQWRLVLFASKGGVWRGSGGGVEGERGGIGAGSARLSPALCPRPTLLVHFPCLVSAFSEIRGSYHSCFLWDGQPHPLQPGLALPLPTPPHSLQGNVSQSLYFPTNIRTPTVSSPLCPSPCLGKACFPVLPEIFAWPLPLLCACLRTHNPSGSKQLFSRAVKIKPLFRMEENKASFQSQHELQRFGFNAWKPISLQDLHHFILSFVGLHPPLTLAQILCTQNAL